MRRIAFFCLWLGLVLGSSASALRAVTIEFDYSYDSSGFFSDPIKKATLEAAGAAWEAVLENVHLPEIPLGTGINTWSLSFNRPDQAATQNQAKNTVITNQPIAENTIVIYVGARPDVYGGLLGFAEFSYSVFGTSAWLKVFQDRDNGDRFASFGGAVSFDSDADWHFDPDPSTKESFPGQVDFYTLALHEVGHLLGFAGVAAFNRLTLSGNFAGAETVALYGSAPPFGVGGHWPDGFTFQSQGMVMAAVLQPNVRNHINPLEVTILRDLGYVPTGGVRVTLDPPGAVAAGARWMLDGGAERTSEQTVTGLGDGEYTLTFKAVPGYVTPAARTIQVVAGQTLQVQESYAPIPVPQIVQGPTSQWVQLGLSIGLQVEAEAGVAELSYQWRKAGKPIKNARSDVLNLANVGLSAAGVYDVSVRSAVGPAATLPAANVGVVGGVTGPAVINEGGTLTLSQAAAGPGISYRWQFNGQDLVNDVGAGVAGADRAKLVIRGVNGANTGTYVCRLEMPDAAGGAPLVEEGHEHGVSVTLRPILNDLVVGPWQVGGTVSEMLTAQNEATRFAAVGLPAGVVLNAATGQLSGRPRLAKTYTVTFTASNAAGVSAPRTYQVPCAALAEKAQGKFDGLVARGVLNAELGGTVKATVLSTGAVSGVITLGRTRHRFSGGLETLPGPNATALISIPRGRTLTPLSLALEWNVSNGQLTGSLSDGQSAPVGVEAWRNPWHARNQPVQGLVGVYTAAIQPNVPVPVEPEEPIIIEDSLSAIPPEPPLIPRGAGFITAKVSAAGMVAWSGRLADGTAVTGSNTLSETGVVGFHALLYGGSGSVQGWSDWLESGTGGSTSTLDGEWDWFKYQQLNARVTNYKGGFPLHALTVTGGKYQAPARNERVLGMTETPERQARLRFAEGGIEQAVLGAAANLEFTLTTANRMVARPVSENPAQTRLTRLTASTGLFQGSLVLQDPRPGGGSDVVRRVSFFGLLVPRLEQGLGYFLLPELTTQTPVPVFSGEVILEKVVELVP